MIFLIGLIWIILTGTATPDWQPLAPGIDLCIVTTDKEFLWGNGRITVVRIDPAGWELVYAGADKTGEALPKTAHQWCDSLNFTAAINAGMFNADNITHTGYVRFRDKVKNANANSYKSVAAFDPKPGRSLPPFCIYDLDQEDVTLQWVLSNYKSAIQNLRLIKKPGLNVWSSQGDSWSEAALGEDAEGRVLFIFSLSPFTMFELNDELLKAGIGIVASQHLEGGSYAQLYLKTGDVEIDLSGTGWEAWVIPNVIGIRRR